MFCATSAGILEENLGCYDDLQVVSCIYIVCKRHVRNAICSDGIPSKERKVARFERWKKHLQHAFQIHFVHSGLTVINHSSTLDSQAAPHAVWRDTKSWCSAASLAQSDALANAQKNSSNIPRDPAETCQTREPRYCIAALPSVPQARSVTFPISNECILLHSTLGQSLNAGGQLSNVTLKYLA